MEIKNKFVEENITENGKVIGKIRFNPNDSKIMYNLALTIENLTSSLEKLKTMSIPEKIDLDKLTTADDFIKSSDNFNKIASAYELEYKTINEAIKKLEEIFGYAISQKYGYLTSCPNSIGTGLKASVKVHLPALSKTGNAEKVLQAINNFGVNIKGVYDEDGNNVGDMYEIFNKKTLGVTENEIIHNIKIIVENVTKQEREARRFLANKGVEIEDIIYRNYGILTNCKKITMREAKNLLSKIKLGVDLGILKELNDLQIQKLYLYIQPGNLQKYYGEQYERLDREIKRAELIKKIVNEN